MNKIKLEMTHTQLCTLITAVFELGYTTPNNETRDAAIKLHSLLLNLAQDNFVVDNPKTYYLD